VEPDQNDIAALVASARNGDEQAVSRLITIHKGLVYTIMIRMVHHPDVARDLTQDAFIRGFRKIRGLRAPEHFKSWLCAIARRIALDHLRTEKRKPTVSLEATGDLASDPDPIAARRKSIIHHALARLSPRDRMLLVLAYYHGLSYREVAQSMKIPEANVRIYVQRARDRLRILLKGREHELLS
jgi:RNA polymerase sigma-70 factor (ECF subfamily)